MKKLIFLAALLYSGVSYGQNYFLNENFNGSALPTGWQTGVAQGSTSPGWQLGVVGDFTSDYFQIPPTADNSKILGLNDDKCGGNAQTGVPNPDPNCYNSNSIVLGPSFDLSNAQYAILKFDAYFRGGQGANSQGQAAQEQLVVGGSMNGGAWFAIAGVPGGGAWQTFTVNLDTMVGAADAKIGFFYLDNDGWMYGAGLDNVQVFEPTIPRQVKLVSVTVPEFNVVDSQNSIKGSFLSTSAQVITSAEVNWRMDGGDWKTSTVTGLNVGYNQVGEFTHPIKFMLPDPKKHNIELMISKVNGEADDDQSDNQLSSVVYGQTTTSDRHVLVEEVSGAWCGYCPTGHVLLKTLIDNSDKIHGVVIHNKALPNRPDNMVIPQGPDFETGVGVTGYPCMTVDRTILPGEVGIQLDNYASVLEKAPAELDVIVPADIFIEDIQFNAQTRDISVKTRVDVYGEYDKPLRFNAYVVEDSVSGTGNGWDQHNYLNDQPELWQGFPNPNYQKGDPIIGYQHMHVLRAFIEGNVWGKQNEFPSGSVQAGQSYNHTFLHTLPADQDEKQIKIIVTVAKYHATDRTKCNVLNTAEEKLPIVQGITKNNALAKSLQVYPNPTNGVLNINYNGQNAVKATVTNSLGQSVGVYDVKGATTIDLTSNPSGVYVLNFNDGVNTYTHKIIVR